MPPMLPLRRPSDAAEAGPERRGSTSETVIRIPQPMHMPHSLTPDAAPASESRRHSRRASFTSPRTSALDEEEEAALYATRARWARKVIRRGLRARSRRQTFESIVRQAREMFLTDAARDAGAEENKFYSNAALMLRASLRQEPEVIEALGYAWQRVTHAELNIRSESRQCGAQARGRTIGSAELSLSRVAYATMIRKLYLTLKERDRDAKIHPNDCLRSVAEDWAKDAGGATVLNEPTFHNCWFELADLNVESVLTDEYAAWIRSSADAITEWRGEGDERWLGWRFDQSLLDSLSGHVKLRPNRNQTGERLSRWLSEGRSTAAFHKMLQSETYAADLLTGRIDPAAAQRDFERQRAFRPRRSAWELAFSKDEIRICGEEDEEDEAARHTRTCACTALRALLANLCRCGSGCPPAYRPTCPGTETSGFLRSKAPRVSLISQIQNKRLQRSP